jgi:tRNA (cytidine/uridine-2'-O-)-methyltransferase
MGCPCRWAAHQEHDRPPLSVPVEQVPDMSDEIPTTTAVELTKVAPAPAALPRFHVVLFEPEIASNTGAIGRTCVAAGARLWLVRPLGFHLDDRHLRRAGLDYWNHLDLRVVNHLGEAAVSLGRDRLWSFSTSASLPYTEAVFQPGDAFVFGPESRGLPRSWLADRPDRTLRIPIRPEARSLNLSCAVAIVLYEALRQICLQG